MNQLMVWRGTADVVESSLPPREESRSYALTDTMAATASVRLPHSATMEESSRLFGDIQRRHALLNARCLPAADDDDAPRVRINRARFRWRFWLR